MPADAMVLVMAKSAPIKRKTLSKNAHQQREDMHRQMLSSVSHDLKTPLASVIGSLEIYNKLGSKLSDDKKETLIKTALQEAYRLDNFITNILDMARLENRTVKIKKESVNIKSVIGDCMLKLGSRASAAKIDIVPDGELYFVTDPNLLTRALYLVLENALKYSSPNAEILIEYGADDKELSITISDNGPGIPEEKFEEIFSKYTRISKQDHQQAGTGLGLAICREITAMLGGKIQAANNPTKGARFEFKFAA